MSDGNLWKEEYKIGNQKIDDQHRELFDKIEALLVIATTADAEENRRECLEIIEFLVSYTVSHFETEEALQRELHYVSYEEHVRIHEQFKNTIRTYRERVENDFSRETLKKFVGTLLTWLAVHIRDCDKKIVRNEPIDSNTGFEGAEDLIRRVARQLLSDTYSVEISDIRTCVYKGYIEGKVIVRTIISGDKNYVFLYGFSEEMAKILYSRISGLELREIDAPDAIERSALIELGDIFSSHVLANMLKNGHTQFEWKGDIFMEEYSDSCINIHNSVLLEFTTDCGRLEIMYCLAGD